MCQNIIKHHRLQYKKILRINHTITVSYTIFTQTNQFWQGICSYLILVLAGATHAAMEQKQRGVHHADNSKYRYPRD